MQKHSSHHCPKQKDVHSHNRQNCVAPYFSMCILRNGLTIKTTGSNWLFLSKMPVLFCDLGKLVQSTSQPFVPIFHLCQAQGPSQATMVVGGYDQHLATIPWLLGTEEMGNRAQKTFSLTLLDLFSYWSL